MLSPKMQSRSQTDGLENLTRQHRVSRGGLVKVLAITAGIAAVAFVGELNVVSQIDTYNRLRCGQTMQEVNRDYSKEGPVYFYTTWLGKKIVGSFKKPNPQKDESCFQNGEYNINTPVRFPYS